MRKCKECGGEGKIKASFGGFNTYYNVECICGRSSRGKWFIAGLAPLGSDYASSDDAPQNTEEEAMKRWDEMNI